MNLLLQCRVQIQCRGTNCDDKRLFCSKLGNSFTTHSFNVLNDPETAPGPWISNENTNTYSACPDKHSFLWGLECRGDYCDEVKPWCVKLHAEFKSRGGMIRYQQNLDCYTEFWMDSDCGTHVSRADCAGPVSPGSGGGDAAGGFTAPGYYDYDYGYDYDGLG